LLENYEKHLPKAPIIRPVMASEEGAIAHIDTRALGVAVIELGGGRRVASDRIDHAVGLSDLAGRSASVGRDSPLAVIHARDEAGFERAAATLRQAYRLGEEPGPKAAVLDRIGPDIR
jgi:thymidine phosphorylase